jgi:hypothetical protein
MAVFVVEGFRRGDASVEAAAGAADDVCVLLAVSGRCLGAAAEVLIVRDVLRGRLRWIRMAVMMRLR